MCMVRERESHVNANMIKERRKRNGQKTECQRWCIEFWPIEIGEIAFNLSSTIEISNHLVPSIHK